MPEVSLVRLIGKGLNTAGIERTYCKFTLNSAGRRIAPTSAVCSILPLMPVSQSLVTCLPSAAA